jgi:hypothetical protein
MRGGCCCVRVGVHRNRSSPHDGARVKDAQGVVHLDELRKTGLLAPRQDSDVLLVVELALRGQFHELPDDCFFVSCMRPPPVRSRLPKNVTCSPTPLARSSRPLRIWREHLGSSAAILRTPFSLGDRATLLYRILRFALGNRSAPYSELLHLMRSSVRGSRT